MQDALTKKTAKVFAEFNVLTAYLFGSQVDGTAFPDSDYDFGVLLNETPKLEDIAIIMQDIGDSLAEIINKDVDIVILNHASIELRFHIISQGKVVYCIDDDKRTDFEDIVIRDYLDWKPFIDKFHREAREAVREGRFYGK